MTALPKLKHTAAAQAAGYIVQLERALYHLATADLDVSVAVEHVDDVSLIKDGHTILQEQDKNTVREGNEPLGDRSRALWRTLQIWLDQTKHQGGTLCGRYLLVSNAPTHARITGLIKGVASKQTKPLEAVSALRSAGRFRTRSKIQQIIDDVLAYSDEELTELIGRVEIVDGINVSSSRKVIANGLAIDPRSDSELILDSLLGWLTRVLQEFWRARQPGVVSRKACVTQCREVEDLLARQRFLPRPAREVTVMENDRNQALTRPFVEHLSRIDAEEEDVFQAVDHFIRFNVEKHRLVAEGEVPDREWRDRGDRLYQRWSNIVRTERRENPHRAPKELGQRILAQSTYYHLESLGGEACNELYMTAGHYHRLADDDEVWWDPTYSPPDGV